MTRAVLAAACVTLLPMTLLADEVRLRDGKVLVGKTKKVGNSIIIKTRDGSVRVSAADVVRVRSDKELREELRDISSRSPSAGTAHVQLQLAKTAHGWALEKEMWRHLGASLQLSKENPRMKSRVRDFMATLEKDVLPKKWRKSKADRKVRELLFRLRGRAPMAKAATIEELLVRGPSPEFDKALRYRARRAGDPNQRVLALRALSRRDFNPNKLSSNERFVYRTAILDGGRGVRLAAMDIAKKNDRDLHAVRYLAPGLDHDNGKFRIRTADAYRRLKDPSALPLLVAAGPRARTARAGGLSGGATRAHMAVINQQAYIRDFDVEVAQAANIANPVVDVLQSGTVLDVTVLAVTTHRTKILRSYRDAIRDISGEDPGADPRKWRAWLDRYNEQKGASKPTGDSKKK